MSQALLVLFLGLIQYSVNLGIIFEIYNKFLPLILDIRPLGFWGLNLALFCIGSLHIIYAPIENREKNNREKMIGNQIVKLGATSISLLILYIILGLV